MDINKQIEQYFASEQTREEFLDFLSGLVEIPSVSGAPEGDCVFGRESANALSYVVTQSDKMGFQARNHDWRCISALYPGSSDEEIGIICHADVVPAAADWRFPPYHLTNQQGLLIGRGVMDDKGPLALAFFAMKFYKDNNIRLPFGIRLIVGGSEEVGTGDIGYYIESGNKPPRFSFTPDSQFPVCCAEKGIAGFNAVFPALGSDVLQFCGGTVSNAVPDYAMCVLNLPFQRVPTPSADEKITITESDGYTKVEARGIAAHAAMPADSRNAIVMLANWLLSNNLLSTDTSRNAMRYIVDAASDCYGQQMGVACSDAVSGELTCILGIAASDNNHFTVNHNMRYPQSVSYENVIAPILADFIMRHGGRYEFTSKSEGYAFSPDSPEIRLLSEAYAMVTGEMLPPYHTGGGTYARAFPNTVAFGPEYGEAESPMGPGRGGIHQSDECVTLEYLMKCGRIYTTAIAHLAGLL